MGPDKLNVHCILQGILTKLTKKLRSPKNGCLQVNWDGKYEQFELYLVYQTNVTRTFECESVQL